MRRLLRTDFARLKASKTFWLTLAGMLAICLYLLLDLYHWTVRYPDAIISFENYLFNYMAFLGFCCAMTVGMFTGADYNDGTMRNKLIVGCERRDIYLSHLIVGFTMGAAVVIVCVGTMMAIGFPMSDGFGIPNGRAVALILLSIPCAMAHSSICTAITLSIQNRTAAVIVAFAVMVALFGAGLVVDGRLSGPEMVPGPITITEEGMEMAEERPNPAYLRGTAREIYQWIDDIMPSGQMVQTADASDPPHMERWPFTSALVILVSSGIGYAIFKRKDIK